VIAGGAGGAIVSNISDSATFTEFSTKPLKVFGLERWGWL